MKKIGILSMQRIYNYGSFLQAYGLKSILENLGCHVVFVDYRPGECLVRNTEKDGLLRKINKSMSVLSLKASLGDKMRFIQHKKNYAKNYYHYLEINDEMNYSPELDLLIIGSDEVFNCVQDNAKVGFTPELFGVGSNAKRVISYAASFGNTTFGKLIDYKVADKVGEWLKQIDSISVRDVNSLKIVERLTGKKPRYNLDPVLMYDYIGEMNEIPVNTFGEKYLLLYGYTGRFNDYECSIIREYANKKNLKIYCIGGIQNCCDRFIDCNPFKVISYFKNADCVITDTYHGTILSVITRRKFVTIIRKSGYGNAEKLMDLLETLSLKNRRLGEIDNLNDLIEDPIEYDNTFEILKVERKNTINYLQEEIKKI